MEGARKSPLKRIAERSRLCVTDRNIEINVNSGSKNLKFSITQKQLHASIPVEMERCFKNLRNDDGTRAES
jgi:hypothetical protein